MTAKQNDARRQFLKSLGSVVAGGAAFAAASTVQAAPIEVPKKENPEQADAPTRGYQRTEHVDTYYKLADF
jgi:hypothetical protein